MDEPETTTNPTNTTIPIDTTSPTNPTSPVTQDTNPKRKSRVSIIPAIKEDVSEIKELLLSKERPKYPKFNPDETSLVKHWFCDIPSYCFKTLCRTQWLRMFLWLVLLAFTTVNMLLWRELYADNCAKTAEVSRLELVETKYQTLKSWAEKDKEWRLRFLIIDRCYSDTVYYRDDINAIQNHIKGNNQKK